MKLSDIHINPSNPRIIKDDRFKKLVTSISEFPKMMKLRPIIVDSDGMILGGNMRFKALKELKYKEVPDEWVKFDGELTGEEKQRFIIEDNVPFGEWDWDILANEWDVGQLADWGLELPSDRGVKLEAVEDDYVIPDEIETDIVLGDLFEIGNHRLLCGDSCDSKQVAKLMNEQKADMVFTDPPFDYENLIFFENILISIKDDCHIFAMHGEKPLSQLIVKYKNIFVRMFAVDFRRAHLMRNDRPMYRVDFIAEFHVGKNKFKNLKDGFTTLIECIKVHNITDKNNFGFNQAKRIELPAKFIEHYSNKNELVVDLFGGAGSTMAASEQLKRRCYVMELEPKNCQIIINRMEEKYNLVKKQLNDWKSKN